jgi:hypothetical protein
MQAVNAEFDVLAAITLYTYAIVTDPVTIDFQCGCCCTIDV